MPLDGLSQTSSDESGQVSRRDAGPWFASRQVLALESKAGGQIGGGYHTLGEDLTQGLQLGLNSFFIYGGAQRAFNEPDTLH